MTSSDTSIACTPRTDGLFRFRVGGAASVSVVLVPACARGGVGARCACSRSAARRTKEWAEAQRLGRDVHALPEPIARAATP